MKQFPVWFSDYDEGASSLYCWQPIIQLEDLVASLDVHFLTEKECDDFIKRELIGAVHEDDVHQA